MLLNDRLTVIKNLLEPVVSLEGVELVSLDFAGGPHSRVLRLYIDKEGGVNVEDCARVSRQVGLVIEEEDAITGPFTLEVSSPGLTRPLKKPEDYIRAKGKLAVLKLRKPLGKERKALVIIDNADDEVVSVTARETGEKAVFPYGEIAHARLEIEY